VFWLKWLCRADWFNLLHGADRCQRLACLLLSMWLCVWLCLAQLLGTIQRLQASQMPASYNNLLMTSQLHHHHHHQQQQQQPSRRDDFLIGNSDLTSLLADDVQTVLKHLGSVRHFRLISLISGLDCVFFHFNSRCTTWPPRSIQPGHLAFGTRYEYHRCEKTLFNVFFLHFWPRFLTFLTLFCFLNGHWKSHQELWEAILKPQ